MRLLIADDNDQITDILCQYALRDGFEVTTVRDGEAALKAFSTESFDLLLLDVMMPKTDGFEVCRTVRRQSSVPIIMVTARGEDFERIMGLEIGADDYIVKPFSPREVMARVKAVLRRFNREEQATSNLSLSGLEMNISDYSTSIYGVPILLTKKETEILWILARHKNKVFTRDNLLNSLWGHEYYGDSRTVDSHIKRLRAKLDVVAHPDWEIKTIWGIGYKLEDQTDD